MPKEGWIHHIVISEEAVLEDGKLATPEKAAFFRQKLKEEQEIWAGNWNGWKPAVKERDIYGNDIQQTANSKTI